MGGQVGLGVGRGQLQSVVTEFRMMSLKRRPAVTRSPKDGEMVVHMAASSGADSAACRHSLGLRVYG